MPQRVPRQQRSSAETWTERIGALVAAGHHASAIFQRLTTEEPLFDASYDAVKRLCRRLCTERPVQPEDVAIRVETPAGEIAQIDFGYVGMVIDLATGQPRRAWGIPAVAAAGAGAEPRAISYPRPGAAPAPRAARAAGCPCC